MRIEDIAREAGVSTATVSRVLNNPERVKPETQERVMAVVRRHEYVPDSLARGLMTKRSKTIGVLIISISNSYYMEITETIQRRLREAYAPLKAPPRAPATADRPGITNSTASVPRPAATPLLPNQSRTPDSGSRALEQRAPAAAEEPDE